MAKNLSRQRFDIFCSPISIEKAGVGKLRECVRIGTHRKNRLRSQGYVITYRMNGQLGSPRNHEALESLVAEAVAYTLMMVVNASPQFLYILALWGTIFPRMTIGAAGLSRGGPAQDFHWFWSDCGTLF